MYSLNLICNSDDSDVVCNAEIDAQCSFTVDEQQPDVWLHTEAQGLSPPVDHTLNSGETKLILGVMLWNKKIWLLKNRILKLSDKINRAMYVGMYSTHIALASFCAEYGHYWSMIETDKRPGERFSAKLHSPFKRFNGSCLELFYQFTGSSLDGNIFIHVITLWFWLKSTYNSIKRNETVILSKIYFSAGNWSVNWASWVDAHKAFSKRFWRHFIGRSAVEPRFSPFAHRFVFYLYHGRKRTWRQNWNTPRWCRHKTVCKFQ